MRHFLFAMLCLLVVTGAMAETVSIPADYATLSAALAGINRTDSVADVININAATITEAVTIAIAPSDEITINGDADADGNCVVVFTAIDAGYGLIAQAATGENVTINDLTLIPSYQGVGANAFVGAGMLLGDANPTGAGTTITLDNCVVSSSSTGEVANDPDAAPPADYTYWDGSAAPVYMYGIRVNDTAASSELTFDLIDCKVAHGVNRGFYIRNDAGTTCNMTRCTARYAGSVAGAFTGIRCYTMNGTWNLTDCESTNNGGDHALDASSGNGNVVINGGLYGDVIGGYNMNLATGGTVELNGTVDAPIVCPNGANRGIRFSNSALQLLKMDYVVVAGCGVYGVSINEWDGTVNPVINHVATVDCGGAIAGGANFDNGDTNTGAVSVTLNDCSFVDNGGATNGGIAVRYGNDKTMIANRCIFAGSVGQYGMGTRGAFQASNELVANDCAFYNVTHFVTTPDTVTSETNSVDANPNFASKDYSNYTALAPTGDFLRPQSHFLGAATTPGGVDILGYSVNASTVPVELSLFSTH